MSNSSTARQSLGSIFGAIAATAGAVTSTVTTLTTGANALNEYVDTAAQKQSIDNKLSLADYEEEALIRLSLSSADRVSRVQEYREKTDSNKKNFDEAYKRLSAVLHPKAESTTTQS